MEKKQGLHSKVILWLVVLVCGITAVVGISSKVRKTEDQVTITPEVLYGDSSLVEGMAVQVRTQISGAMRWTTDFVIGQEEQAQTTVKHLSGPDEEDLNMVDHVMLNGNFRVNPIVNGWQISASDSGDFFDKQRAEWASWQLGDLLDSVTAQCQPGKTHMQTVWLEECFDYYPIAANLPTSTLNLGLIVDGKRYLPEDTKEWFELLSLELQRYFRIPVIKDDRATILVEKDEKGQVTELSLNAWAGAPERDGTYSCMTSAGLYFTMNMSPELYDYSQVPGGYGLYFMPMVEEDGKRYLMPEELATVVSWENDQPLGRLWSDESGEILVMRHDGEEGAMLDLIDVAAGKIIQTMGCGVSSEWGEYERNPGTIHKVLVQEDILVIEFYIGDFLVYQRQENGLYEFCFAVKPDQYESQIHQWKPSLLHAIEYDQVGLDYNGKYLAVSWFMPYSKGIDSAESCDIYVALYGEEGLVYFGVYHNSLSVGNETYGYGTQIGGALVDPITLHWPETK